MFWGFLKFGLGFHIHRLGDINSNCKLILYLTWLELFNQDGKLSPTIRDA